MEKKILIFSILLLCLCSCQSEKRQAEKQAENFLTAYYACDYEKAKTYGTYVTQQLIDEKVYYQSLNPYNETEIQKVKITQVILRNNGMGATVDYEVANSKRQLSLIKNDKGWLVDMSKEEPIEKTNSLTGKETDGGGTASAESEPIRLGDVK